MEPHRFLPLFAACLLTAGTLLVIVPETAQAEGTTSAINSASFAGIAIRANPRIDLDRSGTTVAAVYYGSTNNILFSYSLNSGVTWTHRATGLTDATDVNLNVIVVSATTYYIVHNAGADNTVDVQRTTDSGLTWSLLATDAGLCLVSGVGCAGNFGPWEVVSLGDGDFSYGQAGGTASVRGMIIRVYDAGTNSWSTALSYSSNDASNSWDSFQYNLNTDRTSGNVFWRHTGINRFDRQFFSAGVMVGSSVIVDDTFSPLASKTNPFAAIGNYAFVCAGSPSRVHAVVPNGGSGFNAYNTQALCTGIENYNTNFLDSIEAYQADGNRIAFVTSDSTTLPLSLFGSCDGGVTWARTELAPSGGTSPSSPAIVGVGDAKFLVMFRYGASGIAVVTNDVDTCTGSPVGTPGSGGAAAGSFGLERIFCSERSNSRFGYNYREGVALFDSHLLSQAEYEIDHGYEFQGDTNNYDFLAKTFIPDTASKGMRVAFRIESDQEAAGESVFKVGFSFQDHVAEGMQNADAEFTLNSDFNGDGGDASDLPESSSSAWFYMIEARFEEYGDDWQIRVYYYAAGQRYLLGSTVYVDDPDQATTYSFEVDTTASHPYYKVKRLVKTTEGGVTKYTAQTISNGPLERDVTVAGQPGLNEGVINTFADQLIYSQWFTGHSTSISNAMTLLDNGNREETNPSTCIYDLYGTAIVDGDPGANGPSAAPNGDVQVIVDPGNAAGVPTGGTGTSAPKAFVVCRFCMGDSNITNAFGIIAGLTVVGGATGITMGKRGAAMAAMLGGIGMTWGIVYTFQKGMLDVWHVVLLAFVLVGLGVLGAWLLRGK